MMRAQPDGYTTMDVETFEYVSEVKLNPPVGAQGSSLLVSAAELRTT